MDLQAEFPLDQDIIYLNHAGVAPWPARTRDAVCQFARENVQFGAQFYESWIRCENRLKDQFQTLINAPSPAEISLLKNTSEGISVVAHGLDWQPGDNVIISDQEFPSNRIPWESLKSQGVEVISVSLSEKHPESDILEAINDRTRLIALSSVQFASGLRLNLAPIGQYCRERGILFCVDAIQSLGAHPFDVQNIQADFVVADAHKWLLGPEGVALFYCREAVRDTLQLHQYGWHMVEMAGDYDRPDWSVANSGRRFECGSPNMLGIHGASASLSLLLDVGIEAIEREILARTDRITQFVVACPHLELLSPLPSRRRAGIVTFTCTKLHNNIVYSRLREAGVVCAQRGGGIRFSPHFYTPEDRIERALDILDNL